MLNANIILITKIAVLFPGSFRWNETIGARKQSAQLQVHLTRWPVFSDTIPPVFSCKPRPEYKFRRLIRISFWNIPAQHWNWILNNEHVWKCSYNGVYPSSNNRPHKRDFEFLAARLADVDPYLREHNVLTSVPRTEGRPLRVLLWCTGMAKSGFRWIPSGSLEVSDLPPSLSSIWPISVWRPLAGYLR